MTNELKNKSRRGVLLGVSTQITIAKYLDEGKSFKEIDEILGVPRGSSRYTIEGIRKVRAS